VKDRLPRGEESVTKFGAEPFRRSDAGSCREATICISQDVSARAPKAGRHEFASADGTGFVTDSESPGFGMTQQRGFPARV